MAAIFIDKTSSLIGETAPDFALESNLGETWRLADQRGSVTVLLFYPQNETLVCNRQLCSVRDMWEKYLQTNAVIVGVSASTPGEHDEFAVKHRLPLPLLADPRREVTKIYSEHWLYPVKLTRTIVVIDAKGIVRNRLIMLRAFRPADSELITDIYAARYDALAQKYDELRARAAGKV